MVSRRLAERKNLPRGRLHCHETGTCLSPEEGVQPAQLLLQGCSRGSRVNVLSNREQSQTRNPSSLLYRPPCHGGKKQNNFLLLCRGFASISRNESYPHFNVCTALGTALCINNFCFNKRKHSPGQQQIQGSKRINERWSPWHVHVGASAPTPALPAHESSVTQHRQLHPAQYKWLFIAIFAQWERRNARCVLQHLHSTQSPPSVTDMLGVFIPKIYKGNEHC